MTKTKEERIKELVDEYGILLGDMEDLMIMMNRSTPGAVRAVINAHPTFPRTLPGTKQWNLHEVAKWMQELSAKARADQLAKVERRMKIREGALEGLSGSGNTPQRAA